MYKSCLLYTSERDLLLSYPYESMKPFLTMLHEAAVDPKVVSIKMTLYRLAKDSKVVDVYKRQFLHRMET